MFIIQSININISVGKCNMPWASSNSCVVLLHERTDFKKLTRLFKVGSMRLFGAMLKKIIINKTTADQVNFSSYVVIIEMSGGSTVK